MRLEFQHMSDTARSVASPAPADVAAPVQTSPPPRLSFDLPAPLLRQLVLVMGGYIAVMAAAFASAPGMGLIFTVFALTLLAYYGLPLMLQRAGGKGKAGVAADWSVDTASGRLDGRAVYAQVMTVPLLMLAWAVFIAFLR